MHNRWLSVGEITVRLGTNPESIYKRLTRKKMPANRLGWVWKFLASEVEQWVKTGEAAQRKADKRTTLVTLEAASSRSRCGGFRPGEISLATGRFRNYARRSFAQLHHVLQQQAGADFQPNLVST